MPGAVTNMGMWQGVGDYDALQTLTLHRSGSLERFFSPPTGNRLMHPHYWPWCAMNIAFRREVALLMYMRKMGDGSPYRRFDYIWCGVILQRRCRHLGLWLAAAEPHVRHVRASDPLVNLEKEAPGIRANEAFWKLVDGTPLSAEATPLACAEVVATQLTHASAHDPNSENLLAANPTLDAYLSEEGRRMGSWCEMFRRVGWE